MKHLYSKTAFAAAAMTLEICVSCIQLLQFSGLVPGAA